MKNLNWFQARELARVQKRAIRREGWRHWMLYRFHLWLRSEIDSETGQEVRRVVTAADFRDSEFLAKDWTDDVWEGGTTPPCTTLPPATVIPATPGAGVWTQTDRCGGDGEGGGVLPVVLEPVEVGGDGDENAEVRSIHLKAVLYITGFQGSFNQFETTIPAETDGDGCWINPPIPVKMRSTDPDDGGYSRVQQVISFDRSAFIYFWFSPTGADLSGPNVAPYLFPDHQISTINGVDPSARGFGYSANVTRGRVPWKPGHTVTGRIELVMPETGERRIFLQSYTFPDWCSGYGGAEPIGGFMVS